MKTFLKKGEGFTLIELMVVVAIIGVLSSIAVPNFKKYQAKAKQSEPKIQLAAVYSAEASALAEYGMYGTCLLPMGYEVAAKGYYYIGFTAGTAVTGLAGCNTAASDYQLRPTVLMNSGGAAAAGSDLPRGSIVNNDGPTMGPFDPATDGPSFRAGAAGRISSSGIDLWIIDQTKSLNNVMPRI